MRKRHLLFVLAAGSCLAYWTAFCAVAQERNPKPAPGAERRDEGPGADKRPVDPAFLKYAQSLIAKYDLDESGDLSPNEWKEMARSPEMADLNGDKRVNAEEFARWEMERGRAERGAPRRDDFRGPEIGPARPGEAPGPRGFQEGRPGSGRPLLPGGPGPLPGMPGMRPGMGLFPPDMEALRENDPEMYKLEVADREMERQTAELSGQFRNVPKERREALRKELEDTIAKHFEVRQQRRLLQLSRLEKELQRMRDEIERRNERRGEIVGKRITELVGDKGDLDF